MHFLREYLNSKFKKLNTNDLHLKPKAVNVLAKIWLDPVFFSKKNNQFLA